MPIQYDLYRATKNGLKFCKSFPAYGGAMIEKSRRMTRYPGCDYSIKERRTATRNELIQAGCRVAESVSDMESIMREKKETVLMTGKAKFPGSDRTIYLTTTGVDLMTKQYYLYKDMQRIAGPFDMYQLAEAHAVDTVLTHIAPGDIEFESDIRRDKEENFSWSYDDYDSGSDMEITYTIVEVIT